MQDYIARYKTPFAFIVFIAILLYGNSLSGSEQSKSKSRSGESLSAKDETVTPTASPTASPTLNPTSTPPPGQRPSGPAATSTPTGTPSQKSSNVSIFDFIYPGAKQVDADGDTIHLESTDNPDTITDWYKDKINSFGFKTKSFVVTKTNGNVLNKLVADNGETEIRVEITKKRNKETTKITVVIE